MTDPTPSRRLYPTPAWLIFGLLVVEGLLWLSERYRWFWFNESWTVLIAVAVADVAMLVMLLCFIVSLLFRWRFQFSIPSLLVLVVAVALPFSWLAARIREAKQERDAVAVIENLGGGVWRDGPSWPTWPDNLFQEVEEVQLSSVRDLDAALEPLKELSHLHALYLWEIECD